MIDILGSNSQILFPLRVNWALNLSNNPIESFAIMAPQETQTIPQIKHIQEHHGQYKDQAAGAQAYNKKREEEGEDKATVSFIW